MSLAAVKDALDDLDEPSSCSGSARMTEPFAIALPDGDVGALDDRGFVAWLLAHSEPAPFGVAGQTVYDRDVRAAERLIARGAATVVGFDPALVLPEIERALSPSVHLTATLTDVLVYRRGGKFARHKDTPTSAELIGTLVVVLPIDHEGGALRVTDGRGSPRTFAWGDTERGVVRWAAMFADVDHEIEEVTDGERVSLAYALHATERPRAADAPGDRRERVAAAIAPLAAHGDWPVIFPCARHVVAEVGESASGLRIDALHGFDRDLAEVLAAAGYHVVVRACVAERSLDHEPPNLFALDEYDPLRAIYLLRAPLPADVVANLGYNVTFEDTARDDEREYPQGALGAHVTARVPIERCVVRAAADATLIYEGRFSRAGYFGNTATYSHVFTLAALEVAR